MVLQNKVWYSLQDDVWEHLTFLKLILIEFMLVRNLGKNNITIDFSSIKEINSQIPCFFYTIKCNLLALLGVRVNPVTKRYNRNFNSSRT